MMPELNISETEMGWVYASFIWGYVLFQLPSGVIGKRLGARIALTGAGVFWVITSGLTGLLPGQVFVSGAGILGSLIVIRFLVGMFHAPIYPIQASVVEQWFPPGSWALPAAISSSGLTLGAALAQPLVAFIVVYWGWRASFYVFIPMGFIFFSIWWWYARDNPDDHPGVKYEEIAQIQAKRSQLTQDLGTSRWTELLKNRETLLLTAAYFSQNYVFYLFFTWFFHYLVNELGFGMLETGILAALPWIIGAITATLGGWTCDRLCRRLGPTLGCRIPAMLGLIGTGCFLLAGLYSSSPYIAVVLLSLCFACTQFAEGPFWSAQTHIAGPYTAPACGIMNTGGNLAGLIVAPLMPYLAMHFGWVAALSTGSLVAFVGAGIWWLIKVDKPLNIKKQDTTRQ